MKRIVILGSTGSIGTQALEIISESNRYRVYGLACLKNTTLIVEQARKYKPEVVVVYDSEAYIFVKNALSDLDIKVWSGMEGLNEMVSLHEVDFVLTSIVGNIGLEPTVTAIKARKTIALANKETLVTAGSIIMPLAKKNGVSIIPVDSEHSAIFQCLQGELKESIDKIVLTASGGAFRDYTKEEIRHKKAVDALKHPNWSMGSKITIDSATLMNKGLEFIEAKWLFGVSEDSIEVVVHPQSIIHSMVRFKDRSIISQMGVPDMRVPIIYALDFPNRYPNSVEALDFMKYPVLTFEKPDFDRFPCLAIAMEMSKCGGTLPTVMNAANEVLVDAYLKDKIGFYDISEGIIKACQNFETIKTPTLDDIFQTDRETRYYVENKILGTRL